MGYLSHKIRTDYELPQLSRCMFTAILHNASLASPFSVSKFGLEEFVSYCQVETSKEL